ncbi:hypothetical protein ScPMuIL_001039 [Solemya velum]
MEFKTLLSFCFFCLAIKHSRGDLYAVSGSRILTIAGTTQTEVIRRTGQVLGLALDIRQGYLFWSEIVDSTQSAKIYRSKLDGSDIKAIVDEGLGEILGLAVDWASSHLYWTDARHKLIEVSDYEGQNRHVAIASGLELPRGIVVDPKSRYLYWGDQGTHAIHRSYLDGKEPQVFIQSESTTFWPNQLEISHTSRQLYWADGWSGSIMSCDLDSGSSCSSHGNISVLNDNKSVFGVALESGIVYTGALSSRTVYKVEGETTSVLQIVEEDQDCSLLYMLSVDTSTQPTSDAATCGSCPYMCLWSDSGTQCHCPSYGGYLPVSDISCSKTVDEFLVYADADSGIVGISSIGFASPDIFILAKANIPAAVTYDPVGQMVYFSDLGDRAVYRVKLDGSGLTQVLNSTNGVGLVEGLAVDARQGYLYFTNTGLVDSEAMYTWHRIDMVSISSLDSVHKPIRSIVTDVTKPRGLDIDSTNNQLYHSDWGTETQVRHSDGDGRNMVRLGQKVDFQNPNGLFVQNSQLYVVDSNSKTNSSGKLYKVVNGEATVLIDTLDTPLGLTGDGTLLYITDWGKKAILQYRLSNGILTDRSLKSAGRLVGIQFIDRGPAQRDNGVCETDTNRCDSNDGLCILGQSMEHATCLCPTNENKVLQNFRDCQVPDNYLLFADQEGIKMLSLDEATDRNAHLVARGLEDQYSNIAALAHDDRNNHIYFSDSNSFKIYRANNAGKMADTFLSLSHAVENLAISEGVLYWTTRYDENGTEENSIYSYRMDGSETEPTRLVSGLVKPRGITVDKHRDIYWTESGMLKATSLQGQNARNVASLEDSYNWVNGLSFDSVNRQIYIGASGQNTSLGTIFKCRITEGQSCSLQEVEGTQIDHVFGVLVVDRYIYMSSWLNSSIVRVDLLDQKMENVISNLVRPTQMIMVNNRPVDSMKKYGDCPSFESCGSIECGNDWGCPGFQKCCYGKLGTCSQCVDPTVGCSMDGLEFAVGERYMPDLCQECNCTSSGMSCSSEVCPGLGTCEQMEIPTGKCCPECLSFSECSAKPEFHNCPDGVQTFVLSADSSSIRLNEEESELFHNIYATSCSGQRLEVDISHTFSWSAEPQLLSLKVTDVKGLSSSCVISILVEDQTNPIFTYCPDSQKIITKEENGVFVDWQLPKAVDNSGDVMVVSKSLQPGNIFAIGQHTVTYQASDGSGNMKECQFQIQVDKEEFTCTDPKSILNGDLICQKSSTLLECSVGDCHNGYVKNQTTSDESYQCSGDGKWLPDFPDLFQQQACFKPEKLGLELNFNLRVSDSSSDVGEQQVLDCFKIGNLCPEDRKDAYKWDYFLCDSEYLSITSNGIGIVAVTGTTTTYLVDPEKKEEVISELVQINENIITFFEKGDFVKYCTDLPGKFDDASTDEKPNKFCPSGQFLWQTASGTVCVACNVGTKYNPVTKQCDPCPLNHYQDQEGQLTCRPCSSDYETGFQGAFLLQHCQKKAEPTLGDEPMALAVIVGIAVGGGLGALAIMAVTVYCICKLRLKSNPKKATDPYNTLSHSRGDPAYNTIGQGIPATNPYDTLSQSREDPAYNTMDETYHEIPADAVSPNPITLEVDNPVYNDYIQPI